MRIFLVTSEILGAVKNGGIATATSHLSILLAKSGHDVTLFLVGQDRLDFADRWALFYDLAGVKVVSLTLPSAPVYPEYIAQSTQVFEQLRFLPADVILFQDWLALGHGCMVAKRCGIAFQKTALAVITHGNTPWLFEANRGFPSTRHALATCYMEQRAIELADAVVSPSAHMIQWMSNAGWKLPEQASVIPLFLDSLQFLGAELPPSDRRSTIPRPSHIAFFGRFEERKGIDIFLSALGLKDVAELDFKITFLGRPLPAFSVEEIRARIAVSRPDLLNRVEFKTDLTSDEAQAFLAENDCVPVIPSLIDNSPCVVYESIKLGLPFIASNSGGIPELIHPDDREHCLFSPNAKSLASKLREVLTADSWTASMPSYTSSEVAAAWLDWFESLPAKTARRRKAPNTARPPEITVVVTHYERPHLVTQALRALALQSDPDFDVLLIDDGSSSEAALEFLTSLESGFEDLRLRVIRQSNKYLGAARNEALRHIETPYVIFIDDDDVPFPNFVEVFRRAALSSDADIVTCQMQFFYDSQAEPKLSDLPIGTRLGYSGGPLALATMSNCYGPSTAIFKKRVVPDLGGFHEVSQVGYEDWHLYLRAAFAGRTIFSLPLPLFWYRIAPDSMVRSTSAYQNMRIISEAFKAQVPAQLHPLLDFVAGLHPTP